MLRSSRIFLLFVAAIAIFASVSKGFAQKSGQSIQQGPRDRVLGLIVDSDLITLTGNTHPLARPQNDQGPIDPETRMERMVLLLQPDGLQQQQLDALVEAQQEPGSGVYHQWLTPAEYGSRFGASAGDVARVCVWLASHGFTVEPIPAGQRLVLFSGTAGQVTETFHAQMHSYMVNGESHIANAEDPQIPAALAPVVAGIVSLHDFRRVSATRSIRAIARPEDSQGSTHYLFPADYATIYDLNPLYAAGKNGTGASIAIVGRSNINVSDVTSFRSLAALSANAPTVILDGANPGLVSGDQDESTLDVEWSGAVGSGAAVKFVVAASTSTSDGVDLSAQYIVNNKTATVMSTSYGSCEADMGSGAMAFYNSLWEQAASEGISAFVSSGDSGAAGCNAGSSSSASVAGVNGLCSSPYSTCVGGTEFNEGSGTYWSTTNGAGGGSALSYIPEKVWNESASDGGTGLWATGGGVSEYYTQPSWQKGISGASSSGMRAVPDVAMTAAGHDGYLICENGNWYVISGTSAASPSFAGIMSVVVQKQGGIGQGNANPTLYGLLAASEHPFHATPSGNNSVPGLNGFTASGAAYNLATGLGSVDANVLATAWPAAGSVPTRPGFTLKSSVATESLLPGKSVTFTVAATGIGGFSGAIGLTATAPSGVKVTFSPTSIKPGASATATLAVASGTVAGTGNVKITGTSGSTIATATVALTVQAAPAVTVTLSPTAISMPSTATEALTVTVTPVGGVSLASSASNASFKVTGLPAGIAASWGTPSLTAAGKVQVTLTLLGSSVAVSTTTKPVVSVSVKDTVTGAVYMASEQETLTVTRTVVLRPEPRPIRLRQSGFKEDVTSGDQMPSEPFR